MGIYIVLSCVFKFKSHCFTVFLNGFQLAFLNVYLLGDLFLRIKAISECSLYKTANRLKAPYTTFSVLSHLTMLGGDRNEVTLEIIYLPGDLALNIKLISKSLPSKIEIQQEKANDVIKGGREWEGKSVCPPTRPATDHLIYQRCPVIVGSRLSPGSHTLPRPGLSALLHASRASFHASLTPLGTPSCT